jgi:hypothetical protein
LTDSLDSGDFRVRIAPLNALSNGKSPSPRATGDRSRRLTAVIPNAALRADGGHSHDRKQADFPDR